MNATEKKRLLYRANYRGFKEADILLGGFLKTHIDQLNHSELRAFEHLLCARDHDIYDWITGKSTVPDGYDMALIEKIRQFKPEF